MINTDQIDDWIREVEERPASAPLIIRYIANRLRDLTSRNEELLAENIELRTGKKVEEYESRIGNLEYQLDLLKRQVRGEGFVAMPGAAAAVVSVVIYGAAGHVLRLDVPTADLATGQRLGALAAAIEPGAVAPRLLVTNPEEELLFVFDSGRTVTRALADLPLVDSGDLHWSRSPLVEPRGGEELVFVLPVARMTLFDYCIQSSRRGFARKMMRSTFEANVAKTFVGTGVKQKPDRTGGLVLSAKEDLFVMASREGFLVSVEVADLPFAAEEMLRLSATDHITCGLVLGGKPSLLLVTSNGKAITREVGWLERGATPKGRGQPVFSQARREAGARIAGAAAVDGSEWGAALTRDGAITAYRISDLISAGALGGGEPGSDEADREERGREERGAEVLEFTTFLAPGVDRA